VLQEAAEHGGPFVFMARIVFYKAVHGETPPPIGNPEGKTRRATIVESDRLRVEVRSRTSA
jgi:hypothetical protein